MAVFKHILSWSGIALRMLGLRLWYSNSTFYNRALQLLRNENILFTKIFQSLANSRNLNITPELRTQLLHYTTNASYSESEVDYETLDEIEKAYTIQIDRRVVNSGMIALIFRGSDDAGNNYIIKLKRKNIRETLQFGCESVNFIYTVANWFRPNHILLRVLKPFILNMDDILEQCDFSREIAHLRKAKQDYAELASFVQIPTVYNTPHPHPQPQQTVSDTSFILMEYINGTHCLSPSLPEQVRLRYLEQFCTFMCYGFMYNTIQHTDLHSGNILFTPTGIGIIDFGMAFQPDDDMYDMIISILSIIVQKTPIHEIDYVETFRVMFIPPLEREQIKDISKVEDVCIAITEPLLATYEVDELALMDHVHNLSVHLGREVVLHKDLYKLLLGMSMMGTNTVIMGPTYKNPAKVQEIEKRVIMNVCKDLF